MSGGGGNGPSMGMNTEAARRAAQIQPVPTADLSLGQYPGMGYTPVQNPFTAQGKPPWMQGWFDMPTWGMSAADPTRALTQQDLMAQNQTPTMGAKAPAAPAAATEPQVDPQAAEKAKIDRYLQWKNTERLANSMDSVNNDYAPEDYGYGNYLEKMKYLYGDR